MFRVDHATRPDRERTCHDDIPGRLRKRILTQTKFKVVASAVLAVLDPPVSGLLQDLERELSTVLTDSDARVPSYDRP